jgi:RimJ/RimL family protein N-acetyltransferase
VTSTFGDREPRLSDGVVALRRWERGDLDCVEAVSADPYITFITTVPTVWSPDEGLQFVERQWSRLARGEGVSLAIALEDSGRACGCLTMMHRAGQWSGIVGLGYWVVPAVRRRGIGTRAVVLATGWALGLPGIARIEALVEPVNIASQRVVAAAGFEREGLLRSYLALGDRRADAIIYSRLPVEL